LLLAGLSMSFALFAQQPAPATTDVAQILERLKAIESRLQALEKRGASGEAASGSGRADAERRLIEARGAYREAYGKARADYRNKMVECENLEGKDKIACAEQARAARDKAITAAETARRRAEDEAYALAPGLGEQYID
jgi:hypothetical protein